MTSMHTGMTGAELVAGFEDVGVESGDHVLVHSSLSSLGWVDDGAEAVIEALLQAVGKSGTILFPTLTGTPEDSRKHPPQFDARRSTCWTGTIPRTALATPDAIRSLHPTHSVAAIGALADWLTRDHQLVRTPCGFGSPYDKLASVSGKIVLVGVTQKTNTSFHHAEELAGVPYVLQPEPVDVTLKGPDGKRVKMRQTYLHRWGPKRDYDALEPEMLDLGILRIGQVGETDVRVIDAMFQRAFLVQRLLQDPLATLALSERENWRTPRSAAL